MIRIIYEYRKWRDNWDDLCNRCGMCCYSRTWNDSGEFVADLSSPCKFLDLQTHLCLVYEDRFRKYPTCGKMNLSTAMFHPGLPPTCAYVRTFRPWKHK